MSSRLDERIHELMQQVVDESPIPPILPEASPATIDELSRTSQAKGDLRWWRGPVIALGTAAALIILLTGGALLLRGLDSSNPPRNTIPSTTTPTDAGGREAVSYSVADGLPPGGVDGIATGDGATWAVASTSAGLQMYTLQGDRWLPAGEVLQAPFHAWIVPDGGGGVLLSVPPPGWSEDSPIPGERVVRFDGSHWTGFERGSVMPHLSMSTVTTDPDGTTWIVGYTADEPNRLVVGRVEDGGVSVSVDSRVPVSWPSFLTIGYTVDVAPDGAVWIGRPEGATRFDNGTFAFFGIAQPDAACCYAPLSVDIRGSVWLLRDHIPYRLVDGTWDEMPAIPPSGDVLVAPIVATPDGGVWVFSRAQGTHRFNGSEWVTYSKEQAATMGVPIAGSLAFRTIRAPDGTVVTTDDLHRFTDGQWESLPRVALGSRASADWSRRGISISADGTIWVPTLEGVTRMNPSP